MSRWLKSLCAALAFLGVAVQAAPANVIDELRALPVPAERVKQVDAAALAAYNAALAEYDKQIELHPHDIVDRLQRCRFMDQFVANYEYSGFVDDVSEQADQCRATLVEQHPEHPEIALWQLEQTYGDELLTQGSQLQRQLPMGTWTAGQSARLYTAMARAADLSDKRELALEYSLKALELDETSDVRLIAAAQLIASNDRPRALEILTASVSGGQSQEEWSLTKKMELLAKLGARQQVIALYDQIRELANYDHTEVAKALRAAGANELARQELELATEATGPYTTDGERELFLFELELGSSEQALAAYDAWRNSGWMQDPLGIHRVALFLKDPLLPWQLRDLTALLAFLGALGAIALLSAVPIAGVHYRGLAVRARTGEPYPTDGWRLRHAWMALCGLGAASVLALYSAGAVDVTTTYLGGWNIDATDPQWSRITLVESLLTIVLMLPFGVLAVARQSMWKDAQWTIAKSCLVAAGLALVFRLPLLLAWIARPESMQRLALDDALWQVIGAVRDHYGLITALWVVAVAAPVVEEFVFRGVLLRSFTAHIRPLWANIAQAALFSAMHMNLEAAVLLFVLGLALGALARRSGSLLAPILLHAAFNLIAALILL